jgi:hypothetical protein
MGRRRRSSAGPFSARRPTREERQRRIVERERHVYEREAWVAEQVRQREQRRP